jgi:hypothetical protein
MFQQTICQLKLNSQIFPSIYLCNNINKLYEWAVVIWEKIIILTKKIIVRLDEWNYFYLCEVKIWWQIILLLIKNKDFILETWNKYKRGDINQLEYIKCLGLKYQVNRLL